MRGCGRKLGPRKKVLFGWMVRPIHQELSAVLEQTPQIFPFRGDAKSVKSAYETIVRVEIREVKR